MLQSVSLPPALDSGSCGAELEAAAHFPAPHLPALPAVMPVFIPQAEEIPHHLFTAQSEILQ